MKEMLLALKSASKTTLTVRVDNANGFALVRSDDKKLKDYSKRQYFRQVRDGNSVGQQVVMGKSHKKPVLCYSVPINNDDSFVGALSQCSTLDDISQKVTNLKIGKTGFAFLVDTDNQLIATGDPKYPKITELLTRQ